MPATAIARLAARLVGRYAEFDESKITRDDQGQFSSGGGSGGGSGYARPVPIKVKKISEAIELILHGKVVELPNVGKVHTLMIRLARLAKEAERKGEDAPQYDACQITVTGSSLFCGESLRTEAYPNGLPRIVMPQFSGVPRSGSAADRLPHDAEGQVDGAPEFMDHLDRLGIARSRETVPASHLLASQAQLDGPRIAKKMAKGGSPQRAPIFISRDNYIIDGHHRWAATVGLDAKDNKLGDITMKVIRIDAPVSEVLHLANAWTAKFGIKGRARGAAQWRRAEAFDESGSSGVRHAADPDLLKALAEAWAREQAALAAAKVATDAAAAMEALVERSFTVKSFMEFTTDAPLPPKTLASIAGHTIGLTERQAAAITALADKLAEADGGDLVKAGGRTYRVPAAGADAAFLDSVTGKVADGLAADRAEALASDQTQRALMEGQREVWAQARADGTLSSYAQKICVLGPNPCEFCQAIADAGPVDVADGFDTTGAQFDTGSVPFHTHCQCTEELV